MRGITLASLSLVLAGAGLGANPVGFPNVGATCWMNGLLQNIVNMEPLVQATLAVSSDQLLDDMKGFANLARASRSIPTPGQKPEEAQVPGEVMMAMRLLFTNLKIDFGQQDMRDGLTAWMGYWDFKKPKPLAEALKMSFSGVWDTYASASDKNYYLLRDKDQWGVWKTRPVDPKDPPAIPDPARIIMARPFIGCESLPEALAAWYKPETFAEGDWLVDEHKKPIFDAMVWRYIGANGTTNLLPEFLVINLTRGVMVGGVEKRFAGSIQIPVTLDIAPFFDKDAPRQETVYNLVGVGIHIGDPGGGHYYAYIKDQFDPNRIWYECDDSTVTALGPDITVRAKEYKDISDNGYFFFYRKKSAEEQSVLQQRIKALSASLSTLCQKVA
jgi:hypothetical protein